MIYISRPREHQSQMKNMKRKISNEKIQMKILEFKIKKKLSDEISNENYQQKGIKIFHSVKKLKKTSVAWV